jgi:hypothetical protein
MGFSHQIVINIISIKSNLSIILISKSYIFYTELNDFRYFVPVEVRACATVLASAGLGH